MNFTRFRGRPGPFSYDAAGSLIGQPETYDERVELVAKTIVEADIPSDATNFADFTGCHHCVIRVLRNQLNSYLFCHHAAQIDGSCNPYHG